MEKRFLKQRNGNQLVSTQFWPKVEQKHKRFQFHRLEMILAVISKNFQKLKNLISIWEWDLIFNKILLPPGLKLLVARNSLADITGIKTLELLQTLILIACPFVTNKIISSLPQNIQELNISLCKSIKGKGFKHLQSLTSLRKLDISECLFKDKFASWLPSTLKTLIMNNCIGFDGIGVQSIQASLIHLEVDTNGAYLTQYLVHLSKFQHLEFLQVNCILEDNIILHLPPNLKTLQVSQKLNISIRAYEDLPQLQHFTLPWTNTTSIRSLPSSLESLELKHILLSLAPKDDTLKDLPLHLKNLSLPPWISRQRPCNPSNI